MGNIFTSYVQEGLTLLKKAEQQSMVIDGGQIQGVGMRKTLHDYLEEKGISGIAVNDAMTGNVEVTVEAPTKEDADRAIEALKVIANERADAKLKYTTPKRPFKMSDVHITKEEMDRFNDRSYNGFLRSAKLREGMSAVPTRMPLKEVVDGTADRYRMVAGKDNTLRGMITARALRQLRGSEVQYEFMRRVNFVRSLREGQALAARIAKEREND